MTITAVGRRWLLVQIAALKVHVFFRIPVNLGSLNGVKPFAAEQRRRAGEPDILRHRLLAARLPPTA